jgi:RNA polymerase sigma factor for flagellar operon FliA
VKQASEHLTASLGRTPTVDELAAAVSMPRADVIEVRDQQARAAQLERLLAAGQTNDEVAAASQTLAPEAVVLEQELASCVRDAVSLLPERLRLAVVGHYGEGREMQDVAEELGVTPSRVSQLCSQAIGLLRDGVNGHLDGDASFSRPEGVAARRRSEYVAAVDQLARRRHHRSTRRPAAAMFDPAALVTAA